MPCFLLSIFRFLSLHKLSFYRYITRLLFQVSFICDTDFMKNFLLCWGLFIFLLSCCFSALAFFWCFASVWIKVADSRKRYKQHYSCFLFPQQFNIKAKSWAIFFHCIFWVLNIEKVALPSRKLCPAEDTGFLPKGNLGGEAVGEQPLC